MRTRRCERMIDDGREGRTTNQNDPWCTCMNDRERHLHAWKSGAAFFLRWVWAGGKRRNSCESCNRPASGAWQPAERRGQNCASGRTRRSAMRLTGAMSIKDKQMQARTHEQLTRPGFGFFIVLYVCVCVCVCVITILYPRNHITDRQTDTDRRKGGEKAEEGVWGKGVE